MKQAIFSDWEFGHLIWILILHLLSFPFPTALLRNDSHTVQFIHLNCTVQQFFGIVTDNKLSAFVHQGKTSFLLQFGRNIFLDTVFLTDSFSFSTVNISFHPLLAGKVSAEKSAENLMKAPFAHEQSLFVFCFKCFVCDFWQLDYNVFQFVSWINPPSGNFLSFMNLYVPFSNLQF